MNTYREKLVEAIRSTHGAEAAYERTTPVREVFRGAVVWNGEVESFTLANHPKAKRCYAWGYLEKGEWNITVVLEIPPVVSPETAVKVAIAAHASKK